MEPLFIIVAAFALLGLAALGWGSDSRQLDIDPAYEARVGLI
jgi:hypothetical protein